MFEYLYLWYTELGKWSQKKKKIKINSLSWSSSFFMPRFSWFQIQCRRVYEILRLQVTNVNEPTEYKEYRLDIKRRLNIPFQVRFKGSCRFVWLTGISIFITFNRIPVLLVFFTFAAKLTNKWWLTLKVNSWHFMYTVNSLLTDTSLTQTPF